MSSTKNLALVFSKVPTGWPKAGEHLTVSDIGFDQSQPAPKDGLILEILYCSFDPYLRGRMRDPSVKSYAPGFALHEPIRTAGLGRVLKSSLEGYQEGDVVLHLFPVQQFFALDSTVEGKPRKIDVAAGPDDIRHHLGALGMPGLTAYSSLYEIGKPKKGEVIFISSAAGAVGQLVGVLAKHEGLKVVGSVGSDEKLDFIINTLGFDGGFNYKTEKTLDAFKRLGISEKIDIYYDNVGGEQLATSLDNMSTLGRIVECGQISQYNLTPEERYPIRNTMQTISKRLTMRGFIVTDEEMGPKWAVEHAKNVTKWLKDGSFKAQIHEVVGIENSAEGLIGMWRGENFGKSVLKVKV